MPAARQRGACLLPPRGLLGCRRRTLAGAGLRLLLLVLLLLRADGWDGLWKEGRLLLQGRLGGWGKIERVELQGKGVKAGR